MRTINSVFSDPDDMIYWVNLSVSEGKGILQRFYASNKSSLKFWNNREIFCASINDFLHKKNEQFQITVTVKTSDPGCPSLDFVDIKLKR